jgi:radical SAM superfamily enzyme with C-terminal helix-hairpin-helix motif
MEVLFVFRIQGDPEILIFELLSYGLNHKSDIVASIVREQINEFASRGAKVIAQHPFFPVGLICEIETYGGVPGRLREALLLHGADPRPSRIPQRQGDRQRGRCAPPAGAVNLRLGRQPDLLVYGTKDLDAALPEPNPPAIRRLFSAVRKAAPSLKVLHIDNVNPATVCNHPKASEKALKAIVSLHTPGDVAALGVESVDENVILANNLKVDYDGAMTAVEVINRAAVERRERSAASPAWHNFINACRRDCRHIPSQQRIHEGCLDRD